MTPRDYFRRIPLCLALLMLGMASQARAQKPSTWWYPMGTPEGTRSNDVQLDRQRADSMVIKWRTRSLANSSSLLVGGIRFAPEDRMQQVIGAAGDTMLYIVSHRGLVDARNNYRGLFSAADATTIRLTGLLAHDVLAPEEGARPAYIGVGVERLQAQDDNTFACFLAKSDAKPAQRLEIPPPTPGPDAATARLGLYPLMLVDSSYILAVSRSGNDARDDRINEVRRYDTGIGASPASLVWRYNIAPRIYPQHPALYYDKSISTHGIYIGLSTAPYLTLQPYSSQPPNGATRTSSDKAYSIELLERNPKGAESKELRTDPAQPVDALPTRISTYFMFLRSSSLSAEQFFRLIAQEQDAARPGIPSLLLRDGYSTKDTLFGSFTPSGGDAINAQNHGWTVVVADVDGNVRSRQAGDAGDRLFFHNEGPEILAAYRNADGSDVANNMLWVLRRNAADSTAGAGRAYMKAFVGYAFSGRLLAAGHLLPDSAGGISTNRSEVVIANGDTVKVLRLADYSNEVFDGEHTGAQPYFETVLTFPLEGAVQSAAIADLDNDTLNDLVVSTRRATYAIGARQPNPFEVIRTDNTNYCGASQIVLTWSRSIGGDSTVNVDLLGAGGTVPQKDHYLNTARRDPLNVGAGIDSLMIPTGNLAPGTYRLIVRDPELASQADTSKEFTIAPAQFGAIAVQSAPAPGFGDTLGLSVPVGCADSVYLEQSSDGTVWTGDRPVAVHGDSAVATDTIACPDDICNAGDTVRIWFRYRDRWHVVATQPHVVAIPINTVPLTISQQGNAGLRSRTVTWSSDTFACQTVRLEIAGSGTGWMPLAPSVSAHAGTFTFAVPDTLTGPYRVRICCDGAGQPLCRRGMSAAFEVPPPPTEGFVAPNPFVVSQAPGGAVIVYRPHAGGTVTITIYDAGRALVRTLLDAASVGEGFHQVTWDGTNSRGEIVASGTYICVVESAGQKQIMPIIVSSH
ncbi:MAG TPA: FlgD immunoglobulin-like domain containing protein [Candidatus Kapabacteria bacterium]|nr:FlgD immunoglobulin-like domain containing protein [Candidatus Kapabacteria bacterium]